MLWGAHAALLAAVVPLVVAQPALRGRLPTIQDAKHGHVARAMSASADCHWNPDLPSVKQECGATLDPTISPRGGVCGCSDTNNGSEYNSTWTEGSCSCQLFDLYPFYCNYAPMYYDDDDFTARHMCCSCNGGEYPPPTSSCAVTEVEVSTRDFGNNNVWNILSPDGQTQFCAGGIGNLFNWNHTIPCCLPRGAFRLLCDDPWDDDGWNGGSINIDGVSYCGDFSNGHNVSVSFELLPPTATSTTATTTTMTATPGCAELSTTRGRCGPQYGGRCNSNLAPYALYCNVGNGWCGDTTAHADAQPGTEYDMLPRCTETVTAPTPAPYVEVAIEVIFGGSFN